MKQLVAIDEHGMFADNDHVVRVDSRYVALAFGKRHDSVLRDIKNLDCSEDFNLHNFVEITYKDNRGRKQPAYAMTRDGFVFLVMGYRGKKAAEFKESYIRRFNQMEQFILELEAARMEFPMLTDQIQRMHEHPKPHHYINEMNMLNRIAIGMTAKQFRKAHGIPDGKSIRTYLTDKQISDVRALQMVDVGLLVSGADFKERKRKLQEYKMDVLDVLDAGTAVRLLAEN